MPAFDPIKLINCQKEFDTFKGLLGFKGKQRILSIKADSGHGKSHLLEKFRYHCRAGSNKAIPVSLIALNQLENPTPIGFVTKLVEDLGNYHVDFEQFVRANGARLSGNFSAVLALGSALGIKGSINLQGAHIDKEATGNQLAGVIINNENKFSLPQLSGVDPSILAAAMNTPRLDDEQQKFALTVCMSAFHDDLAQYLKRSHHSMVIILDVYEQCPEDVQNWLMQDFFGKWFFSDSRLKKRLALVVAGQKTPSFHLNWPQPECDKIVKSINGLSKWNESDIRDCVQMHNLQDHEGAEILLTTFAQRGAPALHLMRIVETIQLTASELPQSKENVRYL